MSEFSISSDITAKEGNRKGKLRKKVPCICLVLFYLNLLMENVNLDSLLKINGNTDDT